MFAWLKKRLERRPAGRRGKDHFPLAHGSLLERWAIAELMMAVEGDEVAEVRRHLTQANQMALMMGYESCMMWAIKTGMEKALKPQQTQSLLLAMKKHLGKHGWYQAEAFERIWARVEEMMPMAMNMTGDPNAPPPYPVAELQIALDQAGYHLEQLVGLDVKFGIYFYLTMCELTKAAQARARANPSA
jgi:hypothetical protein